MGSAGRLLFIAHRVPYPPDKGERLRAFHEIRALSERFAVTVAALSHSRKDAEAASALKQWCRKVLVAPAGGKLGLLRGGVSLLVGKSVTEGYFHSRGLRKRIAIEAAREPFDVVVCYSSGTLPYALAAPSAARVIDLVDVDSAKWAEYAGNAGWLKGWSYRRESAAVRRLERRAVELCDAVLLVSGAESAALGVGDDKVMVVPNGVDADFFSPDAVEPAELGHASLVFTGTMDYRPNVEGVCRFTREVFPGLKSRLDDLTFTIVGRDPSPAVRRLAEVPGVSVTGWVPDVRPYLAAAGVVVCPLRIARGVQNKILEAMAMGKAVVASAPALEGLDLRDGEYVLEARSAEQWQEHVLHLLANADAREKLGRAAREHVREKYTWTGCMAPLVSLCERLAVSRCSRRPASARSGMTLPQDKD